MKRKYLAIIYLFILSIGTILSLYIPKNEVTANDAVVIPSDAIRLRILANSDTSQDQHIKQMVRDEVNEEITKWVSHLTSKEEARAVIKAGIPDIQKIAEEVMENERVNQTVKVEFGKVEFPTKLYGQFLYPAGQYEAILITLGEGTGANWWCVLFPPLCFLDFSNGVAVSEGFDEKDEQKSDVDKNKNDEKKANLENKAVELDQANKSNNQSVASEKPVAVQEAVDNGTTEEISVEKVQNKSTTEKTYTQEVEKVEARSNAKEETASVTEETKAVPDAEKEEQAAPVYTGEDEQPVEVKFFVKEIWDKLFG